MSKRSFQQRVAPWMQACFGPEISADKLERGDRFLEEALELLQSGGYPPERVAALTRYVFGREVGEPAQEVGGVMVTLAAYCLAHDLDMHEAGETELARIWTKVEKIRAKQAAKPTGSALPIPAADLPPTDAEVLEHPTVKALVEALEQIADEASVPVHTWKNGINFKKLYNGWRKIATTRIDIARAALAAIQEAKP